MDEDRVNEMVARIFVHENSSSLSLRRHLTHVNADSRYDFGAPLQLEFA